MIHLRDIAKTVVGILAAQFVMYLIVGWTSGTALPLEATFMVAFTLGIFILLAQALHDAWATRVQSPYPPTATVGNSLSEPREWVRREEVKEILEFMRTVTDVVADKKKDLHTNKWLHIAGIVRNVGAGDSGATVTVVDERVLAGAAIVYLTFTATGWRKALDYQIGDEVLAVGFIEQILTGGVYLRGCEVVGHRSATSGTGTTGAQETLAI